MNKPVLEVEGLQTHFFTKRRRGQGGGRRRASRWRPRRGARAGRRIRLRQIGDRLLDHGAGRSARPGGRRLASVSRARSWTADAARRMRRLRGDAKIAMIFQDPMMTLNPVLRVDTQMIETMQAHEDQPQTRRGAGPRRPCGSVSPLARGALARLSAPASPAACASGSPSPSPCSTARSDHRRRADHGAGRDHPGADPLRGPKALPGATGTALIWITHDLAVVAGLADRICGHVCRPHRRGRARPTMCSTTRVTPTRTACIGSVPTSQSTRSASEPDPGHDAPYARPSARRLRLPYPLPPMPRSLRITAAEESASARTAHTWRCFHPVRSIP